VQLNDVTQRVYPMPLSVTEVVVVLDASGGFEKIMLSSANYQFQLTQTPTGVCSQYADGSGEPCPNVWYATVKPPFRS
jgi:hypothetical protein